MYADAGEVSLFSLDEPKTDAEYSDKELSEFVSVCYQFPDYRVCYQLPDYLFTLNNFKVMQLMRGLIFVSRHHG